MSHKAYDLVTTLESVHSKALVFEMRPPVSIFLRSHHMGISRQEERHAVPQQLRSLHAGKEGGCDFGSRRCGEGAVCVGFRALVKGSAGRGRCLRGTAKYVPSYSTRFGCKVERLMFIPAEF